MFVNKRLFLSAQTRFEKLIQPKGNVGVLCGIIQSLVQRNLVKGDFVFSAAADFFLADHLVRQKQLGNFIQTVPVFRAVQIIRHDASIV